MISCSSAGARAAERERAEAAEREAAQEWAEAVRVLTMNLSYDNACNLIHYILNREPWLMKHLRLFIDALHQKTHKKCLPDFNTGASRASALCECVMLA